MSFETLLYRTTPAESASGAVMQTFGLRFDLTLNASTVNTGGVITERDEVAIIQSVAVRALSGSINCVNVRATIAPQNSNQYFEILSYGANNNSAGRFLAFSQSGEIIVPPGFSILGWAEFLTAAATNQVFLSVRGYKIPRGNIQQG